MIYNLKKWFDPPFLGKKLFFCQTVKKLNFVKYCILSKKTIKKKSVFSFKITYKPLIQQSLTVIPEFTPQTSYILDFHRASLRALTLKKKQIFEKYD